MKTETGKEETGREYSPFELRAKEIYEEFRGDKSFRDYIRAELLKADESYFTTLQRLSDETDKRMDKVKQIYEDFEVRQDSMSYRGALKIIWDLRDEEKSYENLIEQRTQRDNEQLTMREIKTAGHIHRKEFNDSKVGVYFGEKNSWQIYPQKRVPLDRLDLASFCGGWRSDMDWEYLQWVHGDRPTPIQWLPRKEELLRVKEFAQKINNNTRIPSILEIGCGTGLLSYLLADLNDLFVVGMDPDEKTMLDQGKYNIVQDHKFVEIPSYPYTHPNLKFITGTSKNMLESFQGTSPDLVISSWMPEDVNILPDIKALEPKGIVLIYQDLKPYSDRFSKPGSSYKKAYRWQGPDHEDVTAFSRAAHTTDYWLSEITNGNIVEFWVRRDLKVPDLLSSIQVSEEEKFSWEKITLQELMSPSLWEAYHTEKYADRYAKRLQVAQDSLQNLQTVEPMEKVTKNRSHS